MAMRTPAAGTWEAESFISELSRVLVANDITQGALARAMGCTRQEVSRWLRGVRRPSLGTMMRMERALQNCLLLMAEEEE